MQKIKQLQESAERDRKEFEVIKVALCIEQIMEDSDNSLIVVFDQHLLPELDKMIDLHAKSNDSTAFCLRQTELAFGQAYAYDPDCEGPNMELTPYQEPIKFDNGSVGLNLEKTRVCNKETLVKVADSDGMFFCVTLMPCEVSSRRQAFAVQIPTISQRERGTQFLIIDHTFCCEQNMYKCSRASHSRVPLAKFKH
jgi:hypothetical protein